MSAQRRLRRQHFQGVATWAGERCQRPQRPLEGNQGRAGFGHDGAVPRPVRHVLRGPLVYSVILSLRSPFTNAFTGFLNYRTVFPTASTGAAWSAWATSALIQVSIMIGLAIGSPCSSTAPTARAGGYSPSFTSFPSPSPGVIAAIKWGFLLEPDLDSALKVPHQLGLAAGPMTPLDYRFPCTRSC